jgi:acetate kinase
VSRSAVCRENLKQLNPSTDEDVFERVIALIEGSSSEHFIAKDGAKSKPRARDLVKVVAHRVVHGGTESEPMAIWPGHEEGLERMDALSAFAPLHVSVLAS